MKAGYRHTRDSRGNCTERALKSSLPAQMLIAQGGCQGTVQSEDELRIVEEL